VLPLCSQMPANRGVWRSPSVKPDIDPDQEELPGQGLYRGAPSAGLAPAHTASRTGCVFRQLQRCPAGVGRPARRIVAVGAATVGVSRRRYSERTSECACRRVPRVQVAPPTRTPTSQPFPAQARSMERASLEPEGWSPTEVHPSLIVVDRSPGGRQAHIQLSNSVGTPALDRTR
jgi:hypothetical protein